MQDSKHAIAKQRELKKPFLDAMIKKQLLELMASGTHSLHWIIQMN